MVRASCALWLTSLLGCIWIAPAAAADPALPVPPMDAAAADPKSTAATPPADPVAALFAVPAGKTPTPQQDAALAKLREEYEPRLRVLVDKVKQTTDADARQVLIKEGKQLRLYVEAEVAKIFADEMPGDRRAGTRDAR